MNNQIEYQLETYSTPITETGCHVWTKTLAGKGYGRMNIEGKKIYAHRASYEMYKGQIPKGLFVCHTCDIPSCINPHHLFLGTQSDNIKDAYKKKRMFYSNKTHCINGHEYNEKNTYIPREHNGRKCRICGRKNSFIYYERKKILTR